LLKNHLNLNEIKKMPLKLVLLIFNVLIIISKVQCLNLSETNCTKSCIVCGKNAEHCIFNPTECSTQCNCKQGYTGVFCENQIDSSFRILSEKAWLNILEQVESNDFKNFNPDFIDQLIRRLNQLFFDFKHEKTLQSLDIYRVSLIFEKFITNSKQILLFNDGMITNILQLIDNIIYLNEIVEIESINQTYNSVIKESNLLFNQSALKLMRSFDSFTKYLKFEQKKKLILNLNNLKYISADLSPLNVDFPFKLEFDNDKHMLDSFKLNKSLLVDSIELNEAILKKKYKNNSIKIAFKIYFNEKNSLFSKQDQIDQFNANIQRPKNFFFEITDQIISNNKSEITNFNDYFISSNILSAEIYENDFDSRLQYYSDSNEDSNHDYVRIQFIVKEIKNEHYLKCVYWNYTSLKWLSNGCYVSNSESGQIEKSRLFRKVCYCNHLTNFALLFSDPSLTTKTSKFRIVFNRILTMLTYIGITISSVCYISMISERLFFQKSTINEIHQDNNNNNKDKILRKKAYFKNTPTIKYRDSTLRSLYLSNAVCLLLTNVFFILILFITPDTNMFACRLIASLLHYFLLAAFCFSLGTAYQHFKKLVKIFNDNYQDDCSSRICLNFKLKWFLFSTLLPLLFAILGYILEPPIQMNSFIQRDSFISPSIYCWLKAPNIYYLFVIPLTLILIISLIFYIFVTIKVFSIYSNDNLKCFSKKKKVSQKSIQLSMRHNSSYNQKRVIALLTFSFVSLGLTWLLGLFIVIASQIDENLKSLMDFLFCLFNSFHGLSLLMGHSIAQRYSKTPPSFETSFTTTQVNSNSEPVNLKPEIIVDNQSKERKLSKTSHFYLIFYGFIYSVRRLFKKKEKKLEQLNKTPILEFTIINNNCDDSDSSQNFQTLQTYLYVEKHRHNEFLPSYFNEIITIEPKKDQNVFTSSL